MTVASATAEIIYCLLALAIQNVATQRWIVFLQFYTAAVIAFVFLCIINMVTFGANHAYPSTVSLLFCHCFTSGHCIDVLFYRKASTMSMSSPCGA